MFQEGCGSEVVWGVADYWVSRVTWSTEEECYHIKGMEAMPSKHQFHTGMLSMATWNSKGQFYHTKVTEVVTS